MKIFFGLLFIFILSNPGFCLGNTESDPKGTNVVLIDRYSMKEQYESGHWFV